MHLKQLSENIAPLLGVLHFSIIHIHVFGNLL